MSDEQQELLQFIYQIPVGVAQLSSDGAFGMANPHAMQMALQIAPGSMNLFDILKEHAPELELLVRDFRAERGVIVEDYRVDFGKRSLRSPYQLVISFTIRKLGPDRMMLVMGDVSRSVAAERAARENEHRLRTISEAIRDFAVIELDIEGQVSDWPPSAERVFGYGTNVVGQAIDHLVDRGYDSLQVLSSTHETGFTTIQAWWKRQDGSSFWGRAVTSVVQDVEGHITGYLIVVKEQGVASRTQPTGGCLERETFDRVARRVFEKAADQRRTPAVAIVLCDRPPENEATSRDVLESVINTVRDNCGPEDAVVSYTTEKLLVLLHDANLPEAKARLDRIRSQQERCVIDTEGRVIQTTLSIGLAGVELGQRDPNPTLARAEAALAEAVERGANQVVIGHPGAAGRRHAV